MVKSSPARWKKEWINSGRDPGREQVHAWVDQLADITFDELRRGVCRTTGGSPITSGASSP